MNAIASPCPPADVIAALAAGELLRVSVSPAELLNDGGDVFVAVLGCDAVLKTLHTARLDSVETTWRQPLSDRIERYSMAFGARIWGS